MEDNLLINNFLASLNNYVSDEELKIIKEKLIKCCDDFDISSKKKELVQIDQGVPLSFQSFMVQCKVDGLAKGTLENYSRTLMHMFYTINLPLEKYTTPIILSYLYHYGETAHGNHKKPPCPRYMDKIRIIINTFFTYCVDNGFLERNPAKSIKPIKWRQEKVDTLSNIELEKLRRATTNIRDLALIDTLYATACRISELLNMKLQDIDWLEGRKDGSVPIKIIGKGNKPRVVYLDARSSLEIKEYSDTRGFDSEYLWCSLRTPHTQLTPKGARDMLHKLGKKAGVENVHPHEFRHTKATNLVKQGVPIQTVSQYLGHANINTTDKFYVDID